jgi:branched-subunit amino acid ABC-type transport system permease component
MVAVSDFLQSILLGSLYALMALGLTLTYAITKVPNFAHAEYITVGGYVVALVTLAFGSIIGLGGLGAAAAIGGAFLLAFLASAALGVLSDELVYRPLFRRGVTPLHLLVASIGVGLVIRYSLSLAVAPGDLLILSARVVKIRLFDIGGAPFTNLHAGVLPTTLAIVIGLHLLLTRTRIGKGMRAMASNFDLARVAGIRTTQVRRVTWLLSGGLAGLGGAFWVVNVTVHPEVGWGILLFLFAASILGGFTSFSGTIAGGFIVGFAENLGIRLLYDAFGVSFSYSPLIALAIIVAVFLLRPQGITGLTTAGLMVSFRRLLRSVRKVIGMAP